MITRQYEQLQLIPQVWGWLGLVLTACLVIGWGVGLHMAIHDAPRYWEFGTYVDTPAESIFSTYEPPWQEKVPAQMALPPNHVNPSARIE